MAQKNTFSEKAQLLAFVLQQGKEWDPQLLNALQNTWAPLLHLGKLFPFDQTSYYQAEMGPNLYRGVLSFSTRISPEKIGEAKLQSNELEIEFSKSETRKVNIDIAYMDLDKVVLPSYKRGPFKIYGGEGIWLDMLLTYSKGSFKPTAWAFEDFVRNPYQKDLLLIREKFKASF